MTIEVYFTPKSVRSAAQLTVPHAGLIPAVLSNGCLKAFTPHAGATFQTEIPATFVQCLTHAKHYTRTLIARSTVQFGTCE